MQTKYFFARALLLVALLSFTNLWLVEAKAFRETGLVPRATADPQQDPTSSGDTSSKTTRKPSPTSSGDTSIKSTRKPSPTPSEKEDDVRSSAVTEAKEVQQTDTSVPVDAAEPSGNPQAHVYKGGMPIVPIVTPGIGIAGVLLMIAGLAQCLIGIKIQRLHIFLSSAFLSALGVTVLIVYVMNPPVGDAIQGAYVVAAAMTGLIVGGLAMVFPEVTENLGCLLGGFCVAMWFLILKPGGLITQTFGKVIMIVVCSIAVFALGFHHITKPYALIFSLSFAGATAVVLGIDCFSKAGMKEFWLYLWELNENIFPLETDDYPHTRGLRVEIAGIILIFALGVMSQVKLWKIVKERKEKKDAVKRLEVADLQAVDEETGRRVEEQHQSERKQWEAKYNGDNNEATEMGDSTPPSRDGSKADSGIGEMRTAGNSVDKFEETPEMKEARQEHSLGAQAAASEIRVIGEATEATAVNPQSVIRVGTDVLPSRSHRNSETPSSLEPIQEVGTATASYDATQQEIERETRRAQVPPTPAVIPLPLPIPTESYNDEESLTGSSIATRAESPQFAAGVGERQSPVRETRPQSDYLMGSPENDDLASSVDATCDEPELVDDDMPSDRYSSGASVVTITEGSSTQNGKPEESPVTTPGEAEPATEKAELAEEVTGDVTPENVGKAAEQVEQSKSTKSVSSARHSKSSASRNASTAVSADLLVGLPQDLAPASFPKSTSPSTVTRSNKSEIQTHCSKIVKTYRTNEWAKHLSDAEKPELDELDDLQEPIDDSEQKPAPLDILALQETAEVVPITRGLPWIETPLYRTETPFRSFSTPTIPTIEQVSRSNTSPVYVSPITNQPATPEARSGTPFDYPTPIRSPAIADRPTPSNRFSNMPTTLLSQRQSMVRSRSSLSNFVTPAEGSRPSNQPIQRPPSAAANRPLSAVGNRQSTPAPYSPVSYTFQPPRELDDDMPLANRREVLSNQPSRATLGQQPPARLKSPVQTTPSPPRQQDSQADRMRNWRESLKADHETQTMAAMAEQRRAEMLGQKIRRIQSDKLKPQSGFTNDDIGIEERMRQGDLMKAHQEAMRRMQGSANRRL